MSVHRREHPRIAAAVIGVLAICLGVAATVAEARHGQASHHSATPVASPAAAPPIVTPPAPTTTSDSANTGAVWGPDGVLRVYGHIVVNKSFALPATFDPGGLDPELIAAFDAMQAEAGAAGHRLSILSGYRSYEHQRQNYERRVAQVGVEVADRGMARPGHSEHQTGLAIDVNDLSTSFGATPTGQWVANNAHRFGFVVRYPEGKEAVTGFKYEPWHLRYFGVDLATELFTTGLTFEELRGLPSQY